MLMEFSSQVVMVTTMTKESTYLIGLLNKMMLVILLLFGVLAKDMSTCQCTQLIKVKPLKK